MDLFLRVESADISLLGGREENQDRVSTAIAEHAALLVVVDGMGGHADGARAAQVTQQVIIDAFWHTPQPLFDPLGFLHLAIGRAHEEVVKLGAQLPLEQRPRATCACAWCSSTPAGGRMSGTAGSIMYAAPTWSRAAATTAT